MRKDTRFEAAAEDMLPIFPAIAGGGLLEYQPMCVIKA
jgi:hypothetical protein